MAGTPARWDLEVDLVCVGSGLGGVGAAIAAHDLGRTVVFGHTPGRSVLVDLPYKIGIDTGCVYGGMLTALELPACVLHSVRRGAPTVERSPLPA